MNFPRRVALWRAAFCSALLCVGVVRAASLEEAERRLDEDTAAGRPLVAHVVVVLADNANQGIVPVPASLGDGANPRTNLYWGAMYGIRGFFRRSPEWTAVPVDRSSDPRVLDRVAFRRHLDRRGRRVQVWIVAEAWRGDHMGDALREFFELGRGASRIVQVDSHALPLGASAHVLAFVGHNGLMDVQRPTFATATGTPRAQAAIVLACLSESYFTPLLGDVAPLLMTTGLMAPEAYTLDAAITSWFSGESATGVRQSAAGAYARYQRISERAAARLFVTPASVPP